MLRTASQFAREALFLLGMIAKMATSVTLYSFRTQRHAVILHPPWIQYRILNPLYWIRMPIDPIGALLAGRGLILHLFITLLVEKVMVNA